MMDITAAAGLAAEGQPRVFSILERMISGDTLPSSLLFTGPDGAGKELAAMRLAAMLECEDGRACGDCSECRKVSRLEHPDVHLVYPVPSADWQKNLAAVIESRREDFLAGGEFGSRARSIGIEQIRTVMERISKQPFSGPRSVVAVMEAHLATTEAQNSFLKVLEEPPPSSVIVLVTGRTDRLLPTILSRCSEIRFDPLPESSIARMLATFLSVEGEEAERIAALSTGNLRRGARLLDERFLGIRSDAEGMVKLVLVGDAVRAPAEAEALAHAYTRDEVADLLGEMTLELRNLMRGKGGDPETVAAAESRDIPADIGRINLAERSLRRNADIELTLVQLLLDLAGKWY
jgi:DNA polymerase III delta' subunit